MSSNPFLIAGGGIAGLASAIALARLDRPSRVLERAVAFETVGAGLQIGPNAVRALESLGVWERIAPASYAPPAILIRDGESGRILQHIRLDTGFERRFGAPYRVIHRADLLAGLLAAAKDCHGIELLTGAELQRFADKGDHVEVTAGSETMTGEALLGADGIRSVIRQALVADGPPVRHREVLFRTLIPVAVSSSESLSVITLWLCRGGHVVHYPVQGGRALNVVAAAVSAAFPGDGWSAPAESRDVIAHFSRAHAELADVLARPAAWQKWAAADRAPSGTWSRNRVTLLGDAAHAALPYLAQGAAMALEDAVVLARCVTGTATIAAAFQAYEKLRQGRTRRIARDSLRQSRIYHAKGPLSLARNAFLRLTDEANFLSRMAWIYDFDPGSAGSP